MGRALARIGDRMLAAVLPHTTAAGCLPSNTYYECLYPHSCNNAHEMSHIRCTSNCKGVYNCEAVGCC
jgi:hypothetical protein